MRSFQGLEGHLRVRAKARSGRLSGAATEKDDGADSGCKRFPFHRIGVSP